jgi:glycosyltransferase involved in cell wall biosynthesis
VRSSQPPLRVLHLSTYASGGGAARAAFALHEAQRKHGIDSAFLAGSGARFIASRALDRSLWRLQKSPALTWRSPARFGSLTAKQINQSSADVVNLHWITDGFLSIEEIGKITKPLVWSFYDMWPFSGIQHYGTDAPNARWQQGYDAANRPSDESGVDLDRWTWQRKLEHWKQPIPIVAASRWMERLVSESALMGAWSITRIPHVVDCDVFTPLPMEQVRRELNLPQGVPLILFMSSAGIMDPRKGFDLLQQAWPRVQQANPNAQIVVIGPQEPDHPFASGLPIIWRGTITGHQALQRYYSASTVTAVPSREDNMPLTAMEAQSCGRPVVAFNSGGLPDIVQHERTGFLADAYQPDSLADGLIAALENREHWGQNAREHAMHTWSTERISQQYQNLYQRVTQ